MTPKLVQNAARFIGDNLFRIYFRILQFILKWVIISYTIVYIYVYRPFNVHQFFLVLLLTNFMWWECGEWLNFSKHSFYHNLLFYHFILPFVKLMKCTYSILALTIAQFRVQYDQYFPSFSYKIQQNIKNEENIDYIVTGKRLVTSLSPICKISIAFIKGSDKI